MSLAVVLLATPLFGLTLQAPLLEPATDLPSVAFAQLDADADLSAEGSTDEEGDPEADISPESAAESVESEGGGDTRAKKADAEAGDDEYEEQTEYRNDLIKLHKPLGIATWASMTVTVGLGFIQYYNLYGFFADQGDNPCVKGDAIFGQSACSDRPWPHTLSASLTTGLYTSTFVLSILMPDPDDLSSGPGEFASTLRLHKFLRWIHFGGMVSQVVLGVIIGSGLLGLDRANDYDTLQTLATVHMATGVITYGALTWAGALMTF
jgi:hypothetical protein